MVNRRRFIGLAAAGAGAVLLGACGSVGGREASTTSASPTAGALGKSAASGAASAATFNVTLSLDIVAQTVDPFALNATSIYAIAFSPAFDTLTRFDAAGKLEPFLATAWRAIDPKTWEFTLREGVKFAGGQDFDASVVKFNVDRLLSKSGQASSFASFQTPIAGAEVVSRTAVRINTKQPDPLLPQRVSVLWMVGPDYPAEVGGPPYNTKTNGTGPFQITQLKTGESYEFTHNPNAWRLRGKPNLVRGLKIVSIPEAAARITALRNHEVDVIFTVTPPAGLSTLTGSGLQLLRAKANAAHSIRFDQLHAPVDHPIRNKLVRQALEYAIDRDALNKAAYSGLYTPLGQAAAQGIFGHDPNIKNRPFDVNKGKELLAQAGYPNGFPLTLALIASLEPEALAITGMWQKIGIDAKINSIDLAAFAQAVGAGRIGPASSSAIAWPFFDSDSGLSAFSNAIPEARQLWSHQQFNEVYSASASELDPAKREKLLQQASAILQEEAEVIPLAQREYVWGVSSALTWTPRADSIMDFETFTRKA